MNIVVNADSAERVLRLACLVDDRTSAEERSLIDIAFRIDQERNMQTVTNPRVEQRRDVSDLVGELGFVLAAKREATRQRRLAAWSELLEMQP